MRRETSDDGAALRDDEGVVCREVGEYQAILPRKIVGGLSWGVRARRIFEYVGSAKPKRSAKPGAPKALPRD